MFRRAALTPFWSVPAMPPSPARPAAAPTLRTRSAKAETRRRPAQENARASDEKPDAPDPARIDALARAVRSCRACADDFAATPTAHAPRPILRASATARLCIASQAPGWRAHVSGKPFDDPSGVRLRSWLRVDEATFWDASRVAILPMAFCFPGHDGKGRAGGKGGDLPPPKVCAALWRAPLIDAHPRFQLVVLVGSHAQAWHLDRLGLPRGRTLAETVRDWPRYLSRGLFPTPHPSWRNTAWLAKNPWFETEALPALRDAAAAALA